MTATQIQFGSVSPAMPKVKARRPKKETDPEVKRFVSEFYQRAGLKCLVWGKEAKAAQTLRRAGYTVEQAVDCRQNLKAQPFWFDKPVELTTLLRFLPDYVKRGEQFGTAALSRAQAGVDAIMNMEL